MDNSPAYENFSNKMTSMRGGVGGSPILKRRKINANKVFNDVISVKLNDVLDQEKIKLANQLYNGQPAEEDDTEGDEDQLELDLDNEEDGGDVSAEAEGSYEDEETEEESGSDVEVEMADDEPSDDDTGGDEEN